MDIEAFAILATHIIKIRAVGESISAMAMAGDPLPYW
jgi:hypothetical protein